MIRLSLCTLLAIVCSWPAAAGTPPAFPPGTSQFFGTFAGDAVVDAGGDVWVALPEGIVRYTAAGAGTVLAVPGGNVFRLALAGDGSIWFFNNTFVGRVSTGGTVLEQYNISEISDITVASDGALWYIRGDMVGRIAGGTPVEFSATNPWSLAPAEDGAVWILRTGFGTSPDFLDRMSPTGAVTTTPLGVDVLFGELQRAPDGTLYVGTGIKEGLLRRRPNQTGFTPVAGFDDQMFLVDDGGNIWSTTLNNLNFMSANGTVRFSVELPEDPRAEECVNVPVWEYRPLVLDSAGGLWLRISDAGVAFPLPLPCDLPEPPEMPTLIRIDAEALVAANSSHVTVPTLSPAMLAGLAALLIAIAALRMRAS
jgi:streptogramin lyase